jgi:uncharacterized protein YoxC
MSEPINEPTIEPGNEPSVTLEDLQKQVQALSEQNEQIVASKKALQDDLYNTRQKYKSLKSDVQREKEEILSEKGSIEEKNAYWEQKYNESQADLSKKQKDLLIKDLTLKVASSARDAHDVNDIVENVAKMKDIVKLDEDDMKWIGVDDAISKLKEDKSYLFKQEQAVGTVSGRPQSQVEKPKSIQDQINDDPHAVFGELLKGLVK